MEGNESEWIIASIASMLSEEFSGEWGDEPKNTVGNARVLRATNLDDNGHVDYRGGAEREIQPSKLNMKRLREGDILLEASGGGPGKPVGRVAIFAPPDNQVYICSNFFRTLRPANTVLPKFLLWRLLQVYTEPKIWGFQQQTTGIINLKLSEYLNQILQWPPLPEQRRIADILDTVDAAIQQTEALIAKLKLMKAGLLHDLLTRGLDEQGNLRDPIAHPEQFKDSPLGRIPKEWEVRSLGTMARIRRGASPRPIDSPVWFSDNGPGWVRIADVTRSKDHLRETEQHLSPLGVSKSVPVHPGQVIMSIAATIGEPIILDIEACIHDGFVVLDEYERFLTANFLVHYLRFRQGYFRNQGQTGTQANLNTGIVKSNLLGVPPLIEQQSIAAILDNHDVNIRAEEAYCDKLKQLKQGLMRDLLTGRVRVQAEEEAL